MSYRNYSQLSSPPANIKKPLKSPTSINSAESPFLVNDIDSRQSERFLNSSVNCTIEQIYSAIRDLLGFCQTINNAVFLRAHPIENCLISINAMLPRLQHLTDADFQLLHIEILYKLKKLFNQASIINPGDAQREEIADNKELEKHLNNKKYGHKIDHLADAIQAITTDYTAKQTQCNKLRPTLIILSLLAVLCYVEVYARAAQSQKIVTVSDTNALLIGAIGALCTFFANLNFINPRPALLLPTSSDMPASMLSRCSYALMSVVVSASTAGAVYSAGNNMNFLSHFSQDPAFLHGTTVALSVFAGAGMLINLQGLQISLKRQYQNYKYQNYMQALAIPACNHVLVIIMFVLVHIIALVSSTFLMSPTIKVLTQQVEYLNTAYWKAIFSFFGFIISLPIAELCVSLCLFAREKLVIDRIRDQPSCLRLSTSGLLTIACALLFSIQGYESAHDRLGGAQDLIYGPGRNGTHFAPPLETSMQMVAAVVAALPAFAAAYQMTNVLSNVANVVKSGVNSTFKFLQNKCCCCKRFDPPTDYEDLEIASSDTFSNLS